MRDLRSVPPIQPSLPGVTAERPKASREHALAEIAACRRILERMRAAQ